MEFLIYRDISFNNLQGPIPSSLWTMRNLKNLDLASNNLEGNISGLNFMESIVSLSLSNNKLHGSIPEISTLSSLEFWSEYYLICSDLSFNFLNGSIPSSLTGSHSLKILILSFNSLNGVIPNSFSSNLTYLFAPSDSTGILRKSVGISIPIRVGKY